MTELLKCPYCGSDKEIYPSIDIDSGWTWFCTNKDCNNAANKLFDTEQEAIDHANKRTK